MVQTGARHKQVEVQARRLVAIPSFSFFSCTNIFGCSTIVEGDLFYIEFYTVFQ